MVDRISTATDPNRVGDETEPWDEFLDGLLDFDALPPEDQARARRFGLV